MADANAILITGGRLVDPVQGIDDTVDVLIVDGRVVQVGDAAATYTRIRAYSVPLWLLWVALREYRYAQNDSQSPMWGSIVANVWKTDLLVSSTRRQVSWTPASTPPRCETCCPPRTASM